MLAARENDGRFGPSAVGARYRRRTLVAAPQRDRAPILDPTPWVGDVEPFLIAELLAVPHRAAARARQRRVRGGVQRGQGSGQGHGLHPDGLTRRTSPSGGRARPTLSWNEVARQLITRNDLNAADSARLLALQNLSGADAAINCWNDKYYYDFWRPWNAIPRAGEDGNAATDAEPGWTALITAPYPEHPSGHNCLDGAHVAILRMFFGDVIDGGFQITSASTLVPAEQRVRTFDTFSQPLAELIDARIWAGLHFRHADVQGQLLGVNVANYGAAHYFQAVGR